MKTKSIIFSGLLLLTLGATTTSCDDMLNVDDELHTQNLAPQDTVYQVMGIINRMQSLVDRTVVLGELRADLVDLDPTVAKTSLQNVMANSITPYDATTGTGNEYNKISDYYAVVNACNVYLHYVDSDYVAHGEVQYEKEIQAVATFRAWVYLELAKTYGKVPFVTEPVTSSKEADDILASTSNRADMNDICTYFINDLKTYADTASVINNPNYGSINGNASSNFFIPSRLMLAELYLWRGAYTQSQSDYVQACKYYHDYFSVTNNEVTPGTSQVKWTGTHFEGSPNDSYSSSFDNDAICILPMDTCAYDGTWSELYGFFNSQFENNYYVPVIPSQRIRELSREQINCVYNEINGKRDTIYSTSKKEWEDSLQMGDLRLSVVYDRSAVSNMYTSQYSQDRQHIMKYATSTSNYGADQKLQKFRLFRKNIVWLHFAEALNRAGFPQTAFVVLKYGISPESIQQFVAADEYAKLQAVGCVFRGNLAAWNEEKFVNSTSSYAGNYTITTQGLHSRGSGDSRYNQYYVLPEDENASAAYDAAQILNDSLSAQYAALTASHDYTTSVDTAGNEVKNYIFESDSDSIAFNEIKLAYVASAKALTEAASAKYQAGYANYMSAVDQMVLDEEALEDAFEGYRFYDLMRYAMYHGDNDYIAKQVARRKGDATTDSRADALKGGNWYLPIPSK